MSQQGATKSGSGLDPKLAALLCYVLSFIGGIVFLVLDKDNKDVKFHAWQSIVIGVPLVGAMIVLSILASAIHYIFVYLTYPIYLAFLAVTIICALKAYQGEKFKVPFIGDIAEQMANK